MVPRLGPWTWQYPTWRLRGVVRVGFVTSVGCCATCSVGGWDCEHEVCVKLVVLLGGVLIDVVHG